MNTFKRFVQRYISHFGYEIRSIGRGYKRTMDDVLAKAGA